MKITISPWLLWGTASLLLALPFFVSAHRSGCHRWHSCPSDTGSYTCGDLGYPCRYPTYPESSKKYSPPIVPAPSPAPLSIPDQVKSFVLAEKQAYSQNPHSFRENLIERLTQKFGASSWVGFYVYTLLPDAK